MYLQFTECVRAVTTTCRFRVSFTLVLLVRSLEIESSAAGATRFSPTYLWNTLCLGAKVLSKSGIGLSSILASVCAKPSVARGGTFLAPRPKVFQSKGR